MTELTHVQGQLAVDEWQTIETANLVLVAEAVQKLIDLPRSVVVIAGPSGAGKHFALTRGLSDDYPMKAVAVSFTGQSGRVDVYSSILEAFTGEVPPGELYPLRQRALQHFRKHDGLLIVRRSERLKRAVMEELEWLLDDYQTRLRLLLLGDDAVLDLIARFPVIDNLVERKVRVEPLSDTEAAEWLPRVHGFYRDVPSAVIKHVNRHFAAGSFHAWHRFTRDAVPRCNARDSVLSVAIANEVIALQRGAELLRASEEASS